MTDEAARRGWRSYSRRCGMGVAGALLALWGAKMPWYEIPARGGGSVIAGFGTVSFSSQPTSVNGMSLSEAPGLMLLALIAVGLAFLVGPRTRVVTLVLGACACVGAAVAAALVSAADAEAFTGQGEGVIISAGLGRFVMMIGIAICFAGAVRAATMARSARRTTMPEGAPHYDDE